MKHLASYKLSKLMKDDNISAYELSKQTGVAVANISRLKNDPSCNPTLSTLIPIAQYFKITVSELIGEMVSTNSNEAEYLKLIEQTIKVRLKKHIDKFYLNIK